MKAKTTSNVEGTCMSLKEYQLLYNELEDNVAGKKILIESCPRPAISEKGLVLFLLVSLFVLYY